MLAIIINCINFLLPVSRHVWVSVINILHISFLVWYKDHHHCINPEPCIMLSRFTHTPPNALNNLNFTCPKTVSLHCLNAPLLHFSLVHCCAFSRLDSFLSCELQMQLQKLHSPFTEYATPRVVIFCMGTGMMFFMRSNDVGNMVGRVRWLNSFACNKTFEWLSAECVIHLVFRNWIENPLNFSHIPIPFLILSPVKTFPIPYSKSTN